MAKLVVGSGLECSLCGRGGYLWGCLCRVHGEAPGGGSTQVGSCGVGELTVGSVFMATMATLALVGSVSTGTVGTPDPPWPSTVPFVLLAQQSEVE